MASMLPEGFVLDPDTDSSLPPGFELDPEPSALGEFGSRLARGAETGFQDLKAGLYQAVADTFRGNINPYAEAPSGQAQADIPALEEQIAVKQREYDELYPQGQGFAEMMKRSQGDQGSTQRFLEIQKLQDRLNQATEASKGVVSEPFTGSLARSTGELAAQAREAKPEIEERYAGKISPYRNQDYWMQVADSVGQSAPSTAAAMLNSGFGLAMMYAQTYEQAKDEFLANQKAKGEKPDEDKAANYAIDQASYQTPWEIVGDVAIAGTLSRSLGNLLKKGTSPSKLGEWIKDRVIDVSKSAAGETLITTPAQTIGEQLIAQDAGVRAPKTAGEIAGMTGEAMKIAAGQSLLMGGAGVAAEGVGRGTRAIFSPKEKVIVEQASKEAELARASELPATAEAIEDIAADEIVADAIAPDEQLDEALDELLSNEIPQQPSVIPGEEFAPKFAGESAGATTDTKIPAESVQPRGEGAISTGVAEQSDVAKARDRIEEAVATGQQPDPADIAIAGAEIAPASEEVIVQPESVATRDLPVLPEQPITQEPEAGAAEGITQTQPDEIDASLEEERGESPTSQIDTLTSNAARSAQSIAESAGRRQEGIGAVYTMVRNGEKKWLVQQSDKRGFGDSIHDTEEEAQKESDFTIRQQKERAESRKKFEAQEKAEKAAKLERENLDGFEADMTPMKKGAVIKQLTTNVNYKGQLITRRDLIRKLVSQGRTVESSREGRRLINQSGEFLGEKTFTKAGMDYAQWLIDNGKVEIQGEEVASKPISEPVPKRSPEQLTPSQFNSDPFIAPHQRYIETALGQNNPVNAEAVDAYDIALPKGYVRQGDLYVYAPPSQEPIQKLNVQPERDVQPVREAAAPKRIQLKGTPQAFEVLETLPPQPGEVERGEIYYRVRNERTGEEQIIEAADISREIKPKSPKVEKAIKKLPKDQQQAAEQATDPDDSPDPYQGTPLTNEPPLALERNTAFLDQLSALGVFDPNANGKTVLQKVSESKSSPDWARDLAKRMLALNPEGISLRAVNRPQSTWSALFVGGPNEILFNLSRRNPGADLTVLHEAAHYLTLEQIRNPEALTGERKRAYEELSAIFDAIKALPEFASEYGASSVEEMVAEAFSNAGFRSKLEGIVPEAGKISLWRRFILAIAKLLTGKNVAPTSLLEKAVENAFTLANAAIIEAPSGQSAAMAESSKVTPEMDAEYMAAVEAGDVAKQQAMVDAAAKMAGYTIGPVYHGTKGKKSRYNGPAKSVSASEFPFQQFDTGKSGDLTSQVEMKPGSYFSPDRAYASGVAFYASDMGRAGEPIIGSFYLSPDVEFIDTGYSTKGEYRASNPNQIKSADPVTYIDGKPVPLSQRFNPQSNLIAAMAEPGSWGNVLFNKHASTEAKAKAAVEATQQVESLDEVELPDQGKPLTPEQNALIESLQDPVGLMAYWANQFRNIPRTDHNDRVSEAGVALVKAAQSFDPEKNNNFRTYASGVIKNRLSNMYRNKLVESRRVTSGSAPAVASDEESESLIDITPTPEDISIQEEELAQLREKAGEALISVMERTSDRDRNILRDYASGMGMREVGNRNGVSPQGVKLVLNRYQAAVTNALFIRGITDISDILTEPQARYEQAEPQPARREEDEQAFKESVVGTLEARGIESGAPILEEDWGISPLIEGYEEASEEGAFALNDRGTSALRFNARGGEGNQTGGENQSPAMERPLSEIITGRPELAGFLDRISDTLKQAGIRTFQVSGEKTGAYEMGLGKAQIRINPSDFDGQSDQFVSAGIQEEIIHALDILQLHQAYINSGGEGLNSKEWIAKRDKELISSILAGFSGLPSSEARAMEDALIAAYNIYQPQYENSPKATTLSEALGALKEDSEDGFSIGQFIHEFARMVIQSERSGKITEETSRNFLEKIRQWLSQAVQVIKNASVIITRGGLQETEFGKYIKDLSDIVNQTIPKEGLSDVAPMAPRQEIQEGESLTVAPLSPRGRKTRTPIFRAKMGPYKQEGLFSAAGKWTADIYKMLQGKEQKTKAALNRLQFVDSRLQNEISREYKGKALPVETLNTALGNTDNRLTKDQADEARKISDPALRESFLLTAKLENLEAFKERQKAAIASLPPKIQESIVEMRDLIDNLSKDLIREGELTDDLKGAIDQNVGTYLHRSYRIFDGDEWTDFIQSDDPEAVKIRTKAESLFANYAKAEAAAQYFRDMAAAGTPVTRAEAKDFVKGLDVSDRVETMLADYLAIADGSVVDTLRGRLPGQKNQSIIKMRGDIPKEIRDLWGQQDDASLNFAKTYASIATFLENNRFLRGVREHGLANGYLFEKDGPRPPGYVEIAGAEGSKSMAPLAGLYGPPELRDAFEEYYNPRIQDWLGTLTTLAMKAKTVYSVAAIVRNFLGNPAFMLANGNLFLGSLGNAAESAWANFRKMGTQEQQERIARMTELGVLGDNVGPGIIKELASRSKKISDLDTPLKWLMQDMGKRLKGVKGAFEGLYSGVDDFWKVYAFEAETAKQMWANPGMTQEQAEVIAADIVRNTVPTYSESPVIVQNLFKGSFGKLIAPFITFTTEVIRTTGGATAQALKEIRSANPRERKLGYGRLAGLSAVATLPFILQAAAKAMFGYDDEDEAALRRGLPNWQKNATILMMPKDKDGNVRFVDLSYLNPYGYFTEPVQAILGAAGSNKPTAEIATDAMKAAAKQILDPFLAEQIAIGAYTDIVRNQKSNGVEVYNPQDSTTTKAVKIGNRIAEAFIPGTADTAKRIYKAATGFVEKSGRSYNLTNEILSPMVGQRLSSYNPTQGLQFQVGRFKRDRADAAQLFNDIFTSQGTVNPSDIPRAYNEANASRKRVYQELRNDYLGAISLGLSREQAVSALKAKQAGQEAIAQVVSGIYKKFQPSAETLKKVRQEFPDRIPAFLSAYEAAPNTEPFDR